MSHLSLFADFQTPNLPVNFALLCRLHVAWRKWEPLTPIENTWKSLAI
jgi:hypothetical protein